MSIMLNITILIAMNILITTINNTRTINPEVNASAPATATPTIE